MRVRRAFCPQVSELLEHRVVPSPAAVQPSPLVLGHPVPLPPPLAANPQVQEAFFAFTQFYLESANTILMAPGPDGVVDPAANRASFDAAVSQALSTLAGDLVNTLGNVPPDAPEVSQVVAAIIGSGPSSLESQLLALPTSSIVQAATGGAATAPPVQVIGQAFSRLTGQSAGVSLTPVPQSGALAIPAATIAAISNASAPSSTQVLAAVRAAFGDFLSTYYAAVRHVLFAPGLDGSVDPTGNRAAFDREVGAALQFLANSIETDLGDAETTVALDVQERLVGDGPGTLESQLAAVPTPAAPSAAVVREFTLSSFRVVVQAFALLSNDIAELQSLIAAPS